MMKRMLAALLMLCLLLTTAVTAQASPLGDYQSDFSASTDGWYPRSTGSASLTVTEEGLMITGRSGDWHSPGRDFVLEPGKEYQLSVQVKQTEVDSANFIVSVAHSKDGVESYENIIRGSAKKGEWTTLAGSYTPGAYDNYVLYVETMGAGTLAYTIKDFSVKPNEVEFDAKLPSLHEIYAPWFDFGCALGNREAINRERMDFYASQFNIMTPGNELKPDSVLNVTVSRKRAKEDDTAVVVRFDAVKPMLDYCQAHGIKVHGHVLVWHSQTPDAFFRKGYSLIGPYVSREVMLARLDNYIRQIMEYMQANYPGLIVSWDVVNEAVDDNTGKLRESNWTKVVGEDFVNRAFEIARKYAPEGTMLYYNDYSTPYEPKLTGICSLLDSLIAEGNIDGYGFQCHYQTNSPSITQLRTAMQKIADKGLKLRVSELDITISADNQVQRTFQAARYKSLMEVFLEFSNQIEAVHTWGVTDDLSWLAKQFPLLFDAQCAPKPAFWSLVEAAQEAAAQP